MEMKFLSVIVPAYKQGERIKQNLLALRDTLDNTGYNYEIICVVDGAQVDDTYDAALEVVNDKIKVVGYARNRGKGYAVKYGIKESQGNVVAYIDAGLDIDANGIQMLIEHMKWYKADIMVASKRHSASVTNFPFLRRMYSVCYQILCRILFNINVKDTQVGLKVYKREVLEKVLPRLLVKRFAFEIELLAVANRLGYTRIYDGPVKIYWTPDNTNLSASITLLLNAGVRGMLLDTLAVFYRLKILKYYDDNVFRTWKYDTEIQMRINTGETKEPTLKDRLAKFFLLDFS